MTMTAASEEEEIFYTTDGSDPTGESIPYTGPIYLNGGTTFKAVSMLDGQLSPVATATVLEGGSVFTDFTTTDWYYASLEEAVAVGLFEGDDGRMRPRDTITRAEFAKALANLEGVDLTLYEGATLYGDVSENAWYASAVNWVTAQGIMNGTGSGFSPQSKITREQICVTLARYAGLTYQGGAQAFADDSSISSWAKDAVYACREQGVVNGVEDNRCAPKSDAIRAQACVMILTPTTWPESRNNGKQSPRRPAGGFSVENRRPGDFSPGACVLWQRCSYFPRRITFQLALPRRLWRTPSLSSSRPEAALGATFWEAAVFTAFMSSCSSTMCSRSR